MNIWGEVVPVDILAVGVHPDDVELSCSGTILKQIEMGYTVGVLDLTEGELGTRGDRETRINEANAAAEMMGVKFRVILDIGDGFFTRTEETIKEIIPVIRASRPNTVLCNALSDRHPDHGRSAKLVADAAFMSGLVAIPSQWQGIEQERWRPATVLHYVQDYFREPDIVVDITAYMDKKIEVIRQFKSQFYDPNSTEPSSPISGKEFLDFIRSKAMVFGRFLQVDYAEAFEATRPIGIKDIQLLS